MKTHTHTTTTFTIPGTEIEVDLPIKPDSIMDYKEPLVKITDDQVILGYLAHDDDCENPLENDDGLGHIYECRRHGDTLRDYERALGLADGGPDLGLIDEAELIAEAQSRIFEDPALYREALEYCREHWTQEDGCGDDKFIRDHLDSLDELTQVTGIENLAAEMWREGRQNGTIGDPYAVLLDVYEHGGISYSLSGTGMQCDFDTARGGAVWVPNSCLIDEIKRRGAVYRKGEIVKGHNCYSVHVFADSEIDVVSLGKFEHWHEAFEFLASAAGGHQRDLATAEQIAARELAKQAAESYTDWCNGNCFGVVVVTYDKGAWTDGQTLGEILNEDACWGFVGDDHAYEALKNDYFPKED